MTQLTKILPIIVLLSINLFSFQLPERTKLDVNYDDEKRLHPNIFIPIFWSDNIFSAIEYRTGFKKEVESAKTTRTHHQVGKIHLLNYQVNDYVFALGYGNEIFNKEQKGYLLKDSTRTDYINKIDITYTSFFGKIDITKESLTPWLDSRFGLLILPSPKLKVEQDTQYSNTYVNGKGNSEKTTVLMYEITLDTKTKSGSFIDVGLDLKYQRLPLKFDLQLSNGATKNFDEEEKILYSTLKLYLNTPISGLTPHIGYENKRIDSTDNKSGKSSSETENTYIFGFDKKF